MNEEIPWAEEYTKAERFWIVGKSMLFGGVGGSL